MQHIPQFVVLIQRAAPGGPYQELMHAGQPLEPAGGGEFIVTEELARWIFSGDRYRVWTTDGRREHRFGITRASQQFLDALGVPEAVEVEPFEADYGRLEGWDTGTMVPAGAQSVVTQIAGNRADMADRQGAAPYIARKG